MIDIPTNSNSLHICMIQTRCFETKFDSTYPMHLNGIISPNEFQESIDRINRASFSNRILKFLIIIFALHMIAAMVCFIIAEINMVNFQEFGYPPLLKMGMCLDMVATVFLVLTLITLQFRGTERIQQVIAEESMKYSAQSPIPCSWRLERTRYCFGGYVNNNTELIYHIVIHINPPYVPKSGVYCSNNYINESSSLIGKQNNYTPLLYAGS